MRFCLADEIYLREIAQWDNKKNTNKVVLISSQKLDNPKPFTFETTFTLHFKLYADT